MSEQPLRYRGGPLRFECTGCGECCKSHGVPSFVYTAIDERRRLARHLGMRTSAFTRRYCEKTNGFWHLRDPASDCLFLEGKRCTVYAARPEQCRSFPFWRENVTERGWSAEVRRGCEGIGKGRAYPATEVVRRVNQDLAREQEN